MEKEEEIEVILLESHKVLIAIEFLLREEKECLTDYGKGLLSGLIDGSSKHSLPMIAKQDYENLDKKVKKLESKNKLLTKELTELKKHKVNKGWRLWG